MLSLRVLLFIASLIFIIILNVIDQAKSNEYRIVETITGAIRGRRNVTLLKEVPFYSFKGIPYAQPPIGELRFKAPKPVESWKPNVLDAFDFGDMCTQPLLLLPSSFPQSEICLTLNIYVPDSDVKSKLAVLFFIHGGGYTEGSYHDSIFGPDFIVEKETILVTINYRLGAFGFLSLDSPEYSGNMGLKDQQLALKWIHANIGRFGGDNKRITVFGQSAGGSATNYHMLSAESRKYFRNGILMSGSAFNY
ncbi:esterase B1-like [Contarinia nasturtii]|uniref:esterase B1-like n=1 Tax=Contarinia nasturtii TaxID=265458 RepID=UPI0012D3CD98|nr:esterase B1-like [Contarinia nasturtii]